MCIYIYYVTRFHLFSSNLQQVSNTHSLRRTSQGYKIYVFPQTLQRLSHAILSLQMSLVVQPSPGEFMPFLPEDFVEWTLLQLDFGQGSKSSQFLAWSHHYIKGSKHSTDHVVCTTLAPTIAQVLCSLFFSARSPPDTSGITCFSSMDDLVGET